MSTTAATTTPPEDRLDLLRAELRVWIDRARPVLEDRLVTGNGLIPYEAALRQVDLIDRLVFSQPALGPNDADRVNLSIMTLRAFDPTPDEEAALLLTKVAGLFHAIDERAYPEHALMQPSPWGPDDAHPVGDPTLVTAGEQGAFALALAHASLVESLRGQIGPALVAPEEAWERTDEIIAFSLLRRLTGDADRFRRASRLALAGDPSEAAFLGKAYRAFRVNAERDWGVEPVASLDATLDGIITQFDETANHVAAELSEVPKVYGRPVPPPPPRDRATELALYELALAHGALRTALARAATRGDGAAPDPWSAALSALDAGAAEVNRALLAALDDPAPRYHPARALGQKWSAYDATVGRLPLDALGGAGRAEVEALAEEVAARAREVVAAVGAK